MNIFKQELHKIAEADKKWDEKIEKIHSALQEAMGLSNEDIYTAYAAKCFWGLDKFDKQNRSYKIGVKYHKGKYILYITNWCNRNVTDEESVNQVLEIINKNN